MNAANINKPKISKRKNLAKFREFEVKANSFLEIGDYKSAASLWVQCYEDTRLVAAITMQAHATGQDMGVDFALPLFLKAANFGSTEAMEELALIYVAQGNLQAAEYWALKMYHSKKIELKENETDAIAWIGREYASAGLMKDAERVFLVAALMGNPSAMLEYGLILLDQGFTDFGIHWLEKSSAKFNAHAMEALGDYYVKFEMPEHALEWFTRASGQGNNDAFFKKQKLEAAS